MNHEELLEAIMGAEEEYEKARGIRQINEKEAENVYNHFDWTDSQIQKVVSDLERSQRNENEARRELELLKSQLREEKEMLNEQEEEVVVKTVTEEKIEILEKQIASLRERKKEEKKEEKLNTRAEKIKEEIDGWDVKLDKNSNFRVHIFNENEDEMSELISFHQNAEIWLLSFLENSADIAPAAAAELINIAKAFGPPKARRGRPPKKKSSS